MLLWLAKDAGWSGVERLIRDGRAVVPPPSLRLDEDEATSLARAVEHALADIPDHDAMLHKTAWSIDFPAWSPIHRPLPTRVRYLRPGTHVVPYEYFSGINKDRLRRFIRFAGHGAFTVEAIPGSQPPAEGDAGRDPGDLGPRGEPRDLDGPSDPQNR